MSWKELWEKQRSEVDTRVTYFVTRVCFYKRDGVVARKFHVLYKVSSNNKVLWQHPEPMENLEKIEVENLERWLESGVALKIFTATSDYHIDNINDSHNPHIRNVIGKRWKDLAARTPISIEDLQAKLKLD